MGQFAGWRFKYCVCRACSADKKGAAVVLYLSDYKRIYEMDLNKGAYEGIRYYFRNFDPTHSRESEVFKRLGYIDVQNLAKRIKAEVLMLTGLMDTTCPPSTQFAVYNKITSNKNVVCCYIP